MPSPKTMATLIDYHKHALLWCHASVTTATVQHSLSAAITTAGHVDFSRLHIADVGILLAVLAGSVANPPIEGFDVHVQSGSTWYLAAIACMKLSRPDIRHIRIIQILSVSADVLGLGAEQLSLLDNVCQPAYEAGFTMNCYTDLVDRLVYGPRPQLARHIEARSVQHQIWEQLCIQDWLATHALELLLSNLAAKVQADRDQISRVTDERSSPAPVNEPCITPAFLDEILKVFAEVSWSQKDGIVPYTSIIELDMHMRRLMKHAAYQHCASNRVVLSHLILLVHRKYLLESVHDEQYAFSRWTSTVAAKEVVSNVEEGIGTAAFSAFQFMSPVATAAVTLCNILHSLGRHDAEFYATSEMLDRAIMILKSTSYSTIASLTDQATTRSDIPQEHALHQAYGESVKLDII